MTDNYNMSQDVVVYSVVEEEKAKLVDPCLL